MTDLLKKPCSCEGNNPNCYMCGGWGYIDSVSESRIPTGQGELFDKNNKKIKSRRKALSDDDIVKKILSSSKIITKPKKQFKICKVCNKEIKDNFSHIPCLFVNHKPPQLKIERAPRKKCLFCNEKIDRLSIDSHIDRFHNKTSQSEREKIKISLNLIFVDL